MPNQGMRDRGRSLEEAFFKQRHEALRRQIALRREQEEACETLAAASGIDDDALLARLAGLGIRAETLAALTLIPLVEVAWADGEMHDRERDAVLRGAESSGIPRQSPSYGLLEIWTRDRPAPELLHTWVDYIRALCVELTDEQRRRLAEKIVGRARAVAQAAGGLLGVGPRVSAQEGAMLAELERAFDARPR